MTKTKRNYGYAERLKELIAEGKRETRPIKDGLSYKGVTVVKVGDHTFTKHGYGPLTPEVT